jgi:hypothetical protein
MAIGDRARLATRARDALERVSSSRGTDRAEVTGFGLPRSVRAHRPDAIPSGRVGVEDAFSDRQSVVQIE